MLEQFHVPVEDRVYVDVDRMRAATEALFMRCGVDEAGAKASTDVLLTNDLRAVETHGVSNMMRNYVASYMAGTLNPTPDLKIVRETATTANFDGDGALGIQIGGDMMQIAIDKAKQYGTGAVTVFDSGHLGGCGYYAAQAAQQGMIGLCMTGGHGTRASGGMLPTFAAESRLGTNPIAWAAPARNEHPFLFDVACTQIANNKVGLARRIGVPLEPGWITDTDGNPFNEPVDPPDEYFLLPFGGTRENGSHKGYGFAAVCAIMCQTLAGVGLSGSGNQYQGGYHFFAAFQIEAFCDHDEFLDNMDDALAHLASAKPAPGHERVLYPGLIEGEETEQRLEEGIPYHQEVIEWYESIGAELGVEISLP